MKKEEREEISSGAPLIRAHIDKMVVRSFSNIFFCSQYYFTQNFGLSFQEMLF